MKVGKKRPEGEQVRGGGGGMGEGRVVGAEKSGGNCQKIRKSKEAKGQKRAKNQESAKRQKSKKEHRGKSVSVSGAREG